MADIVSGSAIEVVTDSAIDIVTTSSVIEIPVYRDIDFSGVEGGLQSLLYELQSTHYDTVERLQILEEQYNNHTGLMEEKISEFFDIFDSFGSVTLEYQSIIMGILAFLLGWFVLWLLYKLFRIFF